MDQNVTIERIRDLIVPIEGYPALKRSMLIGQLERFLRSLSWIAPSPGGSMLDLGASGDLVPAYRQLLGFDRVVCVDTNGESGARSLIHASGTQYPYDEMRVDLEHQPLPFESQTFDQVVAMEVIEHFAVDPMFMLSEANRVLKPGGSLLITTPNITSLASIYKQLWGFHPALGRQAYGPGIMDRHHREYAPHEIREIIQAAGFDVTEFDTFDIDPMNRSVRKVGRLLRVLSYLKPGIGVAERGSTIRCRSTKTGSVAERFPPVIYPRYPYYDYAAFDRKLTQRFDGGRYWRTDVRDERGSGPATPTSSTASALPIND